jgi:hypothetical protein
METSLFNQVDNYCERIDFSFWSEPLNAITNAAFLIGALVAWRIAKQADRLDLGVSMLIANLATIGVGSFLFHTFATKWAEMADVFPILAFILIYLHFATARLLRLPVWAGLLCAAAYTPLSGALASGIAGVVGTVNGSVYYMPVVIAILLYAAGINRRGLPGARDLVIGAGILAVSLTFRSLDQAVCGVLPIGTHFLWHTLNGVMLTWMIVIIIRHGPPRLAMAPARG